MKKKTATKKKLVLAKETVLDLLKQAVTGGSRSWATDCTFCCPKH